jgi:hypothetical protein
LAASAVEEILTLSDLKRFVVMRNPEQVKQNRVRREALLEPYEAEIVQVKERRQKAAATQHTKALLRGRATPRWAVTSRNSSFVSCGSTGQWCARKRSWAGST